MTRLLLIRHGQSTWNEAKRWQGQEDPPLTELGQQQAFHAASALGAVDAIFSSTLERARTTAEIISNQLGVGPVVSHPDLMERNAGEWQGLTRVQIEELFPGFLAEGKRPPSWEPDELITKRVFSTLENICDLWPGGEIIVVTHGGVIYQVEAELGSGFDRIENLGSRRLEFSNGRFSLLERLALVDDSEMTVPEGL